MKANNAEITGGIIRDLITMGYGRSGSARVQDGDVKGKSQECSCLRVFGTDRRYFYRFIINPDPVNEDKKRDLPLREIIDYTMQKLEGLSKTPVQWVAAIHDDHTDKRHIHALAVVKGRLNREGLQILIDAATEEAQLQRHARDLMREVEELQREREEALSLSY